MFQLRPAACLWKPCPLTCDGDALPDLVPPEPTRITVAPPDMDVAVGESVLLPCQARHDPLLRAAFTWYFNGALADVSGGGSHLEKVGGVSPAPRGHAARAPRVQRPLTARVGGSRNARHPRDPGPQVCRDQTGSSEPPGSEQACRHLDHAVTVPRGIGDHGVPGALSRAAHGRDGIRTRCLPSEDRLARQRLGLSESRLLCSGPHDGTGMSGGTAMSQAHRPRV